MHTLHKADNLGRKLRLQSKSGLKSALLVGMTFAVSACATNGPTDLDVAATDRMRASIPDAPTPVRGVKNFFSADEVVQSDCTNGTFLRDLSIAKFNISNRDVASSVSMLSAMGYSVLSPNNPMTQVSCEQLPMIMSPDMFNAAPAMQQQPRRNISQSVNSGPYSSVGSLDIALLPEVNSGDLDELLVFFHPSQQSELQRLETTIQSVVDTPSPQVYIETMVLEVSQEISRDLGIRYTTSDIGSNNFLSLGVLEPGDGDSVSFTRDTRLDAQGNPLSMPGSGIQARVRALAAEEKAEILASPSIMTLSNRQAVIQIVDVVQVPLVQSAIGGAGDLLISGYSFEPLLLGITLNLRPRVSADRKWVSLEIDATVESEVDENSGTVFAPDQDGGRVALAEKQGSSARKVKTITRIPDRTPIVIGGLIAGKKEVQEERVPLIGEIPALGALFGATDREVQKREIVIIITPYVLAEDAIGVRSRTAASDVLDRAKKFRIFDDKHQLLANEVYDLAFLEEDAEYQAYRDRASYLVQNHPELISDTAISAFAQGRVPGYRAVAARTLYDVITLNEKDRDLWLSNIEVEIEEVGSKPLGQIMSSGFSDGTALTIDCVGVGAECILKGRWLEAGESSQGHAFVLSSDQDALHFMRVIATDAAIDLNGGYERLGDLDPGDTVRLPSVNSAENYQPSNSLVEVARNVDDMVAIVRESIATTYADIERVSGTKKG